MASTERGEDIVVWVRALDSRSNRGPAKAATVNVTSAPPGVVTASITLD